MNSIIRSKVLWIIICSAAAIRLIWAGWVDSMDFVVYWKAAQTWVQGTVSPYAYTATERGFVFKYPPFLLPLFLPFGWIDFGAAKILWSLLELGCIAYAWIWLRTNGVTKKVALMSLFLFWWIWLAHFFAGQFTLFLMASALWAMGNSETHRNRRLACVSMIFAAKVFSIFTLLGVRNRFWNRNFLGSFFGLFLTAHLVLLLKSYFGLYDWTRALKTVLDYYPGWIRTAQSGGQELGAVVIRGQMNHGFTAGILRWAQVDVHRTSIDAIVAIVLFGIFGSIWELICRKIKTITSAEKWVGWLGVGLITHPLAWHHSFVLAFPLCTLSLDRAIRSKNKKFITISILGFLCIGILIPNVIGMTLATPLELVSVKSWGVVFSALALVLVRSVPSSRPQSAESNIASG